MADESSWGVIGLVADALNCVLGGGVNNSGGIPYPVARFHPFGNLDAYPPCTAVGIGGVVVYTRAVVAMDIAVVSCFDA